MSKLTLHPATYILAIAEARTFRNTAINLHHSHCRDRNINLEYALSISVMFGFSIELYLKSFMLIVHNGIITKKHNLLELYSEIPNNLVIDFESRYQKYNKENFYLLGLAPIVSANAPKHKPSEKNPLFSLKTFEDALSSISNIFIEARYFFEKINEKQYSILWYNYEIFNALTEILDSAFKDYKYHM